MQDSLTKLKAFLKDNNFHLDDVVLDGEIHGVDNEFTKGWFVGRTIEVSKNKTIVVATFCDWRHSEPIKYKSEEGASSTEARKLEKEWKAHTKLFTDEKDKLQKIIKDRAQKDWEKFTSEQSAYSPSKYLVKKKIGKLLGCKLKQDSGLQTEVLVPMRDGSGVLWGYQKISSEGDKTFLDGGRVQGLFHTIEGKTDVIYICEGFATAAAVHLASGRTTIVSFNASNLLNTAKTIREKYPATPIVIAADDDMYSETNVGKEKALEAALVYDGSSVFPKFTSYEGKPTDWSDLYVRCGVDEVVKQLATATLVNPLGVIKTMNSGFHTETITKSGQVRLEPCYEDLRRYFDQKYNYKVFARAVFVYNGKNYSQLQDDLVVKAFAQEHFNPKPDNQMCNEFEGLVLRTNIVDHSFFENTQGLINLANGIYDIAHDKLIPHSTDYGFRYCLDFNYDPEALSPVWDNMLSKVTRGDESLKKILLEYAGYCLGGDPVWIHKALVLEGEGSNGKSTFIKAFRGLLGDKTYSSVALKDLNSPTKVALLDGKLCNLAEESSLGGLVDSTGFKLLVSGGEVTAKLLYKQEYTYRSRSKFIFSCNEMPHSMDNSHALYRRLIIVPFRATFNEDDPDFDAFIDDKLAAEKSGILNTVLAGYKRLKVAKKFTKSEASEKALTVYKEEQDKSISWVREHLEFEPINEKPTEGVYEKDEKFLAVKDIWLEFKRDMDTDEVEPGNKDAFMKKLIRLVPDYTERKRVKKQNGLAVRGLRGTILLSEYKAQKSTEKSV